MLAVVGPRPAGADGVEPSTRAIVQATDRALYEARYWDILLHYRHGLRGTHSLIDDPGFFLAPTGKVDPAAELAATIDALYRPPVVGEVHAQCRFPARLAWLEEEGVIDPGELPAVSCDGLDKTLARIDPQAATLIFPVGHMNDPASMFGHTLLRIDSSFDSPLLSHAVNYAAQVDPKDNGIAYAFKGIFGLYRGYYSIRPYYEMVKSYSHMDQRDIWEYRLNLSPAEVRRLFLHVWELQQSYADYFFFDENCSYNLLFLLEAARPTRSLTDRFGLWVIPLDTVEEVIGARLVDSAHYRPSQATQIRHIAAGLGDRGRAVAKRLIDGKEEVEAVTESDLSPTTQARLLDLVTEYTQLRYAGGKLDKEVYQRRLLQTLRPRSRLAAEAKDDPPPPPPRPESGHPSQRLTFAAGIDHGDHFIEATYRPAYHDLLDPPAGYVAGSMIEFSALTLRHTPTRQRSLLYRWDLIHIVSLSPRDTFFRPVSWKIRTGFARRPFAGDREGLLYQLNPGGGFTWHTPVGLTYLLGESAAQISRRFDGGYTLGAGLSAGLLAQPHRRWRVQLEARGIVSVAGDATREISVALRQSIQLSRRRAVRLDLQRTVWESTAHTEGKLAWSYYF